MLKLTRHLFAWTPRRGGWIFTSGRSITTSWLPKIPRPDVCLPHVAQAGAFQNLFDPNGFLLVLRGTGMENHAKYNDTIYFMTNPHSM